MAAFTRLKTFWKGTFVRAVGVLAGGTAVAQAVAFLALPLITRLYTPHDFSILAVYAAILGIISVIACLRLEIAIPIPEDDRDATGLLVIAVASVFGISLLTVAVVGLFGSEVIKLLDQPGLGPYLWLLPVGIIFSGLYNAFQFWATRKKQFSAVAKTNMVQTSAGTATQIGMGLFSNGPLGLLLGQIISGGAGAISLGKLALKGTKPLISPISLSDLKRLWRAYERFPKYSTIEALANSAAIQLPIIIIAAMAAGPEAGFLMLAIRVMQAPIALIGGAVGQVYLSHAPQEYRAGRLKPFTLRTFGGLTSAGVGPMMFIGVIAPQAFGLVFGSEWIRAGQLVAWITPWIIMQFLASSISMALHITNNQFWAMRLQVFGLALRAGMVWLAALLAPGVIAETYAIAGFLFYVVYLFIVGKTMEIKPVEFIQHISKCWRGIAAWLFAAGLMHIFFLTMQF